MRRYHPQHPVSHSSFLFVTHFPQSPIDLMYVAVASVTCRDYPNRLQVVKSRIQGAEKIPGVIPKYNWTYPALVTIAREEGFVALYKGFVPKVLRLAPGGGVLLLVVEFTLGVFRKSNVNSIALT